MLNRHVPTGLADNFEEFQSRYVNAFGSPHMRELLSHFPHYMILDDHEIEDNWRQDRIRKSRFAASVQSRHRRAFGFIVRTPATVPHGARMLTCERVRISATM